MFQYVDQTAIKIELKQTCRIDLACKIELLEEAKVCAIALLRGESNVTV